MAVVELGPLVDHHCHGVVTTDLDADAFADLMNEGPGRSPLGTTPWDSMLGVAVRRWCAPLLELPPHADPGTYLARRAALGAAEVNRRLLGATGIDTFLVDTGLTPERVGPPEVLAGFTGNAVGREVVRLEAVAAAALDGGVAAGEFAEAVRSALVAARDGGAVGFKSIAAYRVGLRLPGACPSRDELVAAVRRVYPDGTGAHRVAEPVVNAWLAHTAVELGVPLQFHVGYGDSDVDLHECDPLLLTPFLRAVAGRGVPVLLLHNYPFHRHAAYLAQVFDPVFVDVGLAVHNTGALSAAVVRETLELAPFGKVLFSSDAYGLAELYHLAALLFRRGLGGVLGGLVDDGELAAADADRFAALVARDNARRAYRL
jgi:uncharacterized protein